MGKGDRSMRHVSNNRILYKGRYIRRIALRGYPSCYMVTWSEYGRESKAYYGKLEDLLKEIDDTVAFFGKWAYLI